VSRLFGPAVAQPIALHVTAKRWRCTVEPEYLEALSNTSRATLQAQGGLLDEDARRRFELDPGREAALALREWDDIGKIPGLATKSLDEYTDLLERLATRS
jgi:predicted HD phosphohydrolase